MDNNNRKSGNNEYSENKPPDVKDLLAQGLIVLTDQHGEILAIAETIEEFDELTGDPIFTNRLVPGTIVKVNVADFNTETIRGLVGPQLCLN